MKISTKMYIAAGLLAGLVVATSANAVTVDFANDQATWDVSSSSITSGNVTVSSNGPNITWENDGLGVNGGSQDDEVDNTESLTVAFSAPVTISTIWLDDFWVSTSNGDPEEAFVTFNGTSSFSLFANKPITGVPNPTSFDIPGLFGFTDPVTSILFQAVDPANNSNDGDDYALARIDYTATTAPVPVPAAFWLLGSAMVFLFRKRQTS